MARVQAPRDDKRHAELQEKIKLDATLAAVLAADQKAVTERRLARKARGTFLAYVLIGAAALFLYSAAWLAGQRGRQPVSMSRLVPAKPRSPPVTRTSQPVRPAVPAPGAERPAMKPGAVRMRIVLENCGEIDPADINDYLARDGYRALASCLEAFSPEQVIAAISASGLRERGDSGAPVGREVVFDNRDCMVKAARLALRSMPPGPKPELEILERISKGKNLPDDLDRLDRGAGQGASRPVSTALRYFRDEYEAHIAGKCCPAGRCRALIRYVVNDNCIGCTLCAQVCRVGAIEYRPYQKHQIAVELCTLCDKRRQACQENAIAIVPADPGQAEGS